MGSANIEATKRIIAAKTMNGTLPEAPNGPVVPRFNAKELARAIEQEITRSNMVGWTRISLHMTLDDAARLAKFLRG
jgi:hypothetical protein